LKSGALQGILSLLERVQAYYSCCLHARSDAKQRALVFPSQRKGAEEGRELPFDSPKAFARIMRDLTDARGEAVTLHGLRHAYASTANALGMTEATIGAMIGHAARSVTGRYTHTLDAGLVAAADRTAGEIARWLAEGAAQPAYLKIVTADFDPGDENTARAVLDVDAFTKRLPAAAREALAKRLSDAVGFRRAELRVEGKRAKPEAWGLDIFLDNCRKAFLQTKIQAAVWMDDRGDSPFLKFVDRLRLASDAAPQPRASLKSNDTRSASIKRRPVCLPRDKRRRSPSKFLRRGLRFLVCQEGFKGRYRSSRLRPSLISPHCWMSVETPEIADVAGEASLPPSRRPLMRRRAAAQYLTDRGLPTAFNTLQKLATIGGGRCSASSADGRCIGKRIWTTGRSRALVARWRRPRMRREKSWLG
jgi:hypothetical protein